MSPSTDSTSEGASGLAGSGEAKPRVHPRLAVTLLETIRNQDLPREVFEAEDPSVTLPRRLGLNDAVKHQILRYEEAARKRQRLNDDELTNLIRLAIRRPDSQEIFFLTGEAIGGSGQSPVRGALPTRVAFALARRRVRRLMKSNFGRMVGGFGASPFTFEGRALPFIQADPGGDACELVTGLCQAAVRRYFGDRQLVVHIACQAYGSEICRWRSSPVEGHSNADPNAESEGG